MTNTQLEAAAGGILDLLGCLEMLIDKILPGLRERGMTPAASELAGILWAIHLKISTDRTLISTNLKEILE